MIKTTRLALAPLLFFGVFLGLTHANPVMADDAAEVRAAHLALERAMNSGDVETMATYMHPDYSSFTGNGGLLNEAFDKIAMKANFQRGLSFNSRSKHVSVKIWGNAGLLTAYSEGAVTMPGGGVSQGTSRVSSVWLKHEGKWKQAHLHQSPALPHP